MKECLGLVVRATDSGVGLERPGVQTLLVMGCVLEQDSLSLSLECLAVVNTKVRDRAWLKMMNAFPG